MSPSRMPTRLPQRASAMARFTDTVVLPTPPFPAPTAMTFFTPGSAEDGWSEALQGRTRVYRDGELVRDLAEHIGYLAFGLPAGESEYRIVSTASRATIGGMAGNNSCGGRSLRYGTMRDNTLSMDAALADGTLLHFGEVPRDLAQVNSPQSGLALFRDMLDLGEREAPLDPLHPVIAVTAQRVQGGGEQGAGGPGCKLGARRQAEVAELAVNEWVQLVSCDPDTGAMLIFEDGGFVPYTPARTTLPVVERSRDWHMQGRGHLPPALVTRALAPATA